MTDTSVATTEPHRPPATSDDKPKRKQIRGKLAVAIDRMIEDGEHFLKAARAAGLTGAAIRKALDKPHVIAHLRERKQILRARMSAPNYSRLCQIRDAGDNMPAVQAIKLLEQMDETTNTRAGSGTSQVPGFTIVVQHVQHITGSHTEQQRETSAKPLILHAADRLTESVDR